MALHFILDGYNVIKKTAFLNQRKLKDARDALLKFIEIHRPQGSLNNKITVVFDGKKDVSNFAYSQESSVIFTKGESADDCIKSMVDKQPIAKNTVVVTDDKQIRFYCRCQGASILGVDDFIKKAKKKTRLARKPSWDSLKISALEKKKINEELSKIWLK